MKLVYRLIEAADTGNIGNIKSLLEEGADVNGKNVAGGTSLMYSSINHNGTSSLDKVKFLLDNGADINAKNKNGMSSLMYSSMLSNSTSSLDTVRLLLEKGADVNSQSTNGMSSLMYSSMDSNSNSSLDTVRLLLDSGADINAKNKRGQSSLMLASLFSITTSSDDTIRLLLSYGADVLAKNNEGKYPLDQCRNESCKKIISNAMWKIINDNVKKLSGQYSTKTPISKDIWELILLRNKQRQLCKDLSKEENKYVLQGFSRMLNIPITEKMTKRQLCNLVSKQISQGRKLKTNKENFPDIIKLAKTLGININQPIDKILDDISLMV